MDDGQGSKGVLAVDTIGGGTVQVTVLGVRGRDTESLAVADCGPDDRRSARPVP